MFQLFKYVKVMPFRYSNLQFKNVNWKTISMEFGTFSFLLAKAWNGFVCYIIINEKMLWNFTLGCSFGELLHYIGLFIIPC